MQSRCNNVYMYNTIELIWCTAPRVANHRVFCCCTAAIKWSSVGRADFCTLWFPDLSRDVAFVQSSCKCALILKMSFRVAIAIIIDEKIMSNFLSWIVINFIINFNYLRYIVPIECSVGYALFHTIHSHTKSMQLMCHVRILFVTR